VAWKKKKNIHSAPRGGRGLTRRMKKRGAQGDCEGGGGGPEHQCIPRKKGQGHSSSGKKKGLSMKGKRKKGEQRPARGDSKKKEKAVPHAEGGKKFHDIKERDIIPSSGRRQI